MLYVRREFGDEKSQLHELNCRLDQYLSRVRHLETENQHLVDEINKLRLEREAQWTQKYHSEVCELRKRVEDLTIQKCEAELQRDNLFQELQELQELWEQVRSMRMKIDQQLALYKQDLQQAQQSQVALEQLYIQLQQEFKMLQGSHEEEMVALRNQAFQTPLQITMQEVQRPKLSLTDVEIFSLELSDSWKDAFVFYQKKIEDLENIVRLSADERHGTEEEVTIYKLQAENLRKEYEELLAIKARLEDELLRMKAKYRLEVDEYEIIIEELETERKTITLHITERLKDYHDLMQVKTGLSLEVAAYRALLEAESKQGSVIITEHHIRDRPAGYVTSALEETTRVSKRGQEKFDYPIVKSKDEIHWKTQTSDSGRFLTRTVPHTQTSPRYTNLGNTSNSYGSRIYEITSQERRGKWDTNLSTRYDSSHKSDTKPAVMYQTVQPIYVSPSPSTQSTIISQTSQQEQIKDQKPVARPRTHSKETRRGQIDIKVEKKQQESDSQKVFVTKDIKDMKSETQSVTKAKHVIEDNVKSTTNGNRVNYDETVSVTETVQKEIQEPKIQELPVKKERKKREQAKKRKEEQENVAIDKMNVTEGSTLEVNETTNVKKTTVPGDKANDKPIVYEIPIQFVEGKQGNIEQKTRNISHTFVNQATTSQRNIDESGKTNSEYTDEKILVDSYLKQLGHSPVFDTNKTGVLENNQGSGFMKTLILGEKSEDNQLVMEIPIQFAENRKENNSYKEDVKNSVQGRYSENVNKIIRNEVESLEDDKMNKLHQQDVEFSRAEEPSSISSETIEKKAFVADILKQLGQPSDVDDTNVTYLERKEKCSDGSMKTEIFVESKTEEEIDLFDEPDLTDLWNTTSMSSLKKSKATDIPVEEIQSRKFKKTLLEDITGAEAEEWIGKVIHTGLKESPGKSVNVEIVEESIGTFAYDKGEYATPFHVEEADDNYNKGESVYTEETLGSERTDQVDDISQPIKVPAQVEELTEGEHVDEEIDYLVFIPDDHPYVSEEEEETIRGQIHTQEESHVTYSWQDEFLQGSQGRKSLSEMLKQAAATEECTENYRVTAKDSDSDKVEQKETSHVDTVDEKTNIYESSVDRDDEWRTQVLKDDRHVETLEMAKAATYGSSVDSSDSFDLKKQEEHLYVKTFGAEKADSYGYSMDNSERFDTEEQKGEPQVETVVIEKIVKASPEIQSSIINLLSKDIKDPQQKLKGTLDCLQGRLPRELAEELSILAAEEQTKTSSLAVDIKNLGQTDKSGTMTIVAEISVSKTLDAENIDDLDFNEGIETEERTIYKSQAMPFEDVICVLQKEGSPAGFEKKSIGSEDSYNSVTARMNNKEESYTSEQNVVKSPSTTTVHVSPTREVSFGQMSTDVSTFIKHIELDALEQIFQEDSGSAESSAASQSPVEANRSEHHIKLTSREPTFNKQIIFEGPISKPFKLDIAQNIEESSEQNRSIRHIKISPTENVSTEQIIFQGPLFKTVGMGATGELPVQEKHGEHVNQASKSLVFERYQVGSQETESTPSASTTVSHFKVTPGESLSKQVMFEGGIPRTYDFNIQKSDGSEDDSSPIEHSSATHKIHVQKQVKFQGFVSQQHAGDDYSNIEEQNDPAYVNTSVHHIKLSPSKEHIVFEPPVSEDTSRSIRHIRLGSPEAHTSEHLTFEGPTTESYETSDFFVSSPSGDSTESERSIKHIKLGPKEKTFTFQMDITKIARKHSEEKGSDNSGMLITSSKFEGPPEFSQSGTEVIDDPEVSESGYGEEEIAGVSQFAYEILPQSQNITEKSELEKAVEIQRIVHRSNVVSDQKRVAIVYLDEEEEIEEEEEADQDYLRRSF